MHKHTTHQTASWQMTWKWPWKNELDLCRWGVPVSTSLSMACVPHCLFWSTSSWATLSPEAQNFPRERLRPCWLLLPQTTGGGEGGNHGLPKDSCFFYFVCCSHPDPLPQAMQVKHFRWHSDSWHTVKRPPVICTQTR